MPTRVIDDESGRKSLIALIEAQKLPITVQVTKGRNRSLIQNALAFRWYSDISSQLGDQTVEEVRAFCKLTIGVPMLRKDNEQFRETYNRVLLHIPYEEKLRFIKLTELPVTRIMGTKQMAEYLDEVARTFSAQGCVLTDPEAMRRGEA